MVDSPLQVDDIHLVPLGSQTGRVGGGPSLQAFDTEGESLFDDVEEQRRLDSSYGGWTG
jgi:hypothetical protein